MSESNLHSLIALRGTAPTLADRLSLERQRTFVGRDEELALLEEVLGDARCSLLFLRGAAGVGKTSILLEYQRLQLERSASIACLDGHQLRASTGDEQRRLIQTLNATFGSRGKASRPRPVLLVDSYERLSHGRTWFHEQLIPSLPSDVLLVLASRLAPPAELALDPAWLHLMRHRQVEPLDSAHSKRLLDSLGVAPAAQHAVIEVALGYPLALAVAGQALRATGADTFTVDHLRQLQNSLMQLLCPAPTSNGQQLALEACALARTTTVDLLQRVLSANPEPDQVHAPELFEWLANQPFIERGHAGLEPQPLARLALSGRVRRDHPKKYQATYRPVREYCVDEIAEGSRPESAMGDLLYLDRDVPLVNRLGASGEGPSEPDFERATELDSLELVQLVRSLEGDESAELAAAALRSEPQTFEFTRAGSIDGLFQLTTLTGPDGIRNEDRDPAARLAKQFMLDNPLPEGAGALFFRWFLSKHEYQSPRGRVLTIVARQTHLLLTSERLAYSLCVFRSPEEWDPLWDTAGSVRERVGTFQSGRHSYSLMAFRFEQRSLRDTLVDAWLPQTSGPLFSSTSSIQEQKLKVEQRVAELGRRAKLTARELEILSLLCLGSSFEEIAAQLQIRPRTVKFHQENLLRKTGSSSRIELFRKLI